MQFETLVLRQAVLGHFVNPMWFQSIRRKVDVADAVLSNEEIDNLGKFLSQRRLTAAEPKVRERRRVLGELYDFVPRQIALLVQFIPVEAAVAGGVAVGGDEKDERVQLSTAPRYTSVRLGEMSLYRICRHVMLRVSADRTRLYSNSSAVNGANRI